MASFVVGHSLLGVSALATVARELCAIGAIDELLLRKRAEFARLDEFSSFHSASGGEGPA